jgi:hypothetical protein
MTANPEMSRTSSLELLLMPLPPPNPHAACTRALGIRMRIEQVYGALPFLTEQEQARAHAWLRIAEDDQRQYQGRIVWQEDPARA